MFINFSDIPGHQNLFLDYLYEFENVADFFANDFRNRENYLKIFRSISESRQDFASRIPDIISNQYANLNPSGKTAQNIKKLADKKTLAIVTGQQLGILGGPLYTFYKIITAIKLSQFLSERYDDYNFVPVFWLEGDDHDFNEVRTIKIIDDNNSLVTVGYKEEIEEDDLKQSVGLIKLDNSINDFFTALEKELKETEFKSSLLQQLKNCFQEGRTFKAAFRDLIFNYFDNYGLVIFDPQTDEVKQLLKPIFKKEITDFRIHTEQLVHVSATLEELYHAQVKVKPVNLFLRVDEGRHSIEPVENEFRLRRKRKSYTQEQLLEVLENEPDKFSPNVLLRPICQDYLLPTAFYIAGPSEIAYFAQLKPLYELYNIVEPIIYPRSSLTILENSIAGSLDKFSIGINDVFVDVENVKKRIINSVEQSSVDEMFSDISNQLENSFDQLKEKLFDLDKTIADSSNRYRDKILGTIAELKSKAEKAQQKKYEVTLRQIDRAAVHLFPNSNLQEREINFVYFVNKYGDEFLKRIFDELQINKFEHQVIRF
ncbi:MAG: bacillithiol biosynthesis cysteine-adding enzyme BshC [Ignavibacteriae bacterium]|nr:MAG: bacillithiol biosynthesis cysteine-adding enzyme BshC [Chlorobiota bacterium]MBE7477692.1 bacillithiol biosynthesis cysteine-adding enzyme BshC [Ignavibacteriales bacterium]MBL1123801.1 bacillithiol biosynthesis cysteine-adding enzyme BshC [Ignavibacteriota bacterium]MCC7092827.1 bacillithiol biosynthesis cysteine-adding enzyme BshC [Ignavibacteriaceae bacterium]MCE7855962.1 bacillithiol biosynthesis cysteine-adding enzyme BshC [Ignavibacteria bacterium CHB3]MEB2295229.1 bacillithiol b